MFLVVQALVNYRGRYFSSWFYNLGNKKGRGNKRGPEFAWFEQADKKAKAKKKTGAKKKAKGTKKAKVKKKAKSKKG